MSLEDQARLEEDARKHARQLREAEERLAEAAVLLRDSKHGALASRALALKGEVEILQKKLARAAV